MKFLDKYIKNLTNMDVEGKITTRQNKKLKWKGGKDFELDEQVGKKIRTICDPKSDSIPDCRIYYWIWRILFYARIVEYAYA